MQFGCRLTEELVCDWTENLCCESTPLQAWLMFVSQRITLEVLLPLSSVLIQALVALMLR